MKRQSQPPSLWLQELAFAGAYVYSGLALVFLAYTLFRMLGGGPLLDLEEWVRLLTAGGLLLAGELAIVMIIRRMFPRKHQPLESVRRACCQRETPPEEKHRE